MSHQFTSEKAWTQPAASTLKLEEGLHVALAAGILNLDAPLQVNNPNTLFLGLGMATLVSSIGNAVISVADMPGVRVAGQLEWRTSSYAGDAQNPGMLHVADALKRTRDTSLNCSVASGKLCIAIRSNSASGRLGLMTSHYPSMWSTFGRGSFASVLLG